MKKILLQLIIALLLPCLAIAGTSYYVDSVNGNDANTGLSDSQAWKTISKVNSFSFSTGDDVYFKCGGQWDLTETTYLYVDWTGTEADPVVIGAYYVDGGAEVIGVSGEKPYIRGDYTPDGGGIYDCSDFWNYAIMGKEDGTVNYVTIQDLKIGYYKGGGIRYKISTHGVVSNCEILYTLRAGIMFENRADYGLIENCTVGQSSRIRAENSSCDRPFALGFVRSSYGTARRNYVYQAHGEGIGVYANSTSTSQWAGECTIEYNTVADHWSGGIYLSNSINNVVRYNLVYGTTDTTFHHDTIDGVGYCPTGIGDANEEFGGGVNVSTGNKFYGNLVAFCSAGFTVGGNPTNGLVTDLEVYNNTFIACAYGVSAWSDQAHEMSFVNNLIIKDTGYAMDDGDFDNVIWNSKGYNLWSEAPNAALQATTDIGYSGGYTTNDTTVAKTSGWHDLTAGSLSISDFALGSTNDGLNAGSTLAAEFGYTLNETESVPHDASSSIVSQDDNGSGWEIGGLVSIETTYEQVNTLTGGSITGGSIK